MTERERLVALCDTNNGWVDEVPAERFADYLLANGAIVPPVKIGQEVYHLYADIRFAAVIEKIEITPEGMRFRWTQYENNGGDISLWDSEDFGVEDIGKTVFLNISEYLKAVTERSDNA